MLEARQPRVSLAASGERLEILGEHEAHSDAFVGLHHVLKMISRTSCIKCLCLASINDHQCNSLMPYKQPDEGILRERVQQHLFTQVQGKALFPAAGMLEAARAACAVLLPEEQSSDLMLAEISIPSPLLLPSKVNIQ